MPPDERDRLVRSRAEAWVSQEHLEDAQNAVAAHLKTDLS